jgi:hypothetical protein
VLVAESTGVGDRSDNFAQRQEHHLDNAARPCHL